MRQNPAWTLRLSKINLLPLISPILRLSFALCFVLVASGYAAGADLASADAQSLKDVITRARAIPATSLHQWLREGAMVADTFSGNISFDDAVKAAKAAKLPLLEGWQNGSAILRRYELKKSVFQLAEGKTADAYLFFRALNQQDGAFPFAAQNVRYVEIGLLVHVGLSYHETLDRKILPDGSAFRRSLELDDVKTAGASWPRLDRILINYGHGGNRWLEFNPAGFHFTTRFDAPRMKELGTTPTEISGFIVSGLDPSRDRQGIPEPGDFKAEDTISDPTFLGSSGYIELPEELKMKAKAKPRTR
jgi:hypothetical protein